MAKAERPGLSMTYNVLHSSSTLCLVLRFTIEIALGAPVVQAQRQAATLENYFRLESGEAPVSGNWVYLKQSRRLSARRGRDDSGDGDDDEGGFGGDDGDSDGDGAAPARARARVSEGASSGSGSGGGSGGCGGGDGDGNKEVNIDTGATETLRVPDHLLNWAITQDSPKEPGQGGSERAVAVRKLHSAEACVVGAVGAMIEKASHGGEAHGSLRPPPTVIEQMLKGKLLGSRSKYIRANTTTKYHDNGPHLCVPKSAVNCPRSTFEVFLWMVLRLRHVCECELWPMTVNDGEQGSH